MLKAISAMKRKREPNNKHTELPETHLHSLHKGPDPDTDPYTHTVSVCILGCMKTPPPPPGGVSPLWKQALSQVQPLIEGRITGFTVVVKKRKSLHSPLDHWAYIEY